MDLPRTRKLESTMKYQHYLKVKFSGAFPIDMLRYDRCYPDKQEDVTVIENSLREVNGEPRTVILMAYNTSQKCPFELRRWKSFCCEVEPSN